MLIIKSSCSQHLTGMQDQANMVSAENVNKVNWWGWTGWCRNVLHYQLLGRSLHYLCTQFNHKSSTATVDSDVVKGCSAGFTSSQMNFCTWTPHHTITSQVQQQWTLMSWKASLPHRWTSAPEHHTIQSQIKYSNGGHWCRERLHSSQMNFCTWTPHHTITNQVQQQWTVM